MVDKDDDFKDAWGDDFNFSLAADDLTIEYSGTNKPAQFSTDITKNINASDWSVALSQINILTINET